MTIEQTLAVIAQWFATHFVKTLAIWCIAYLLAFVWTRLAKWRPIRVAFELPRREAACSLLIAVPTLGLLFILTAAINLPDDVSLGKKLLVDAGAYTLMCLPVILVLIVKRQRLATAGLSRQNMPGLLLLGVCLAAVTLFCFAGLSALDRGTVAEAERWTAQRRLYTILTFSLSAFAHEFIYRGYLQTRLEAGWGRLAGLLAASAIYAAWHLPYLWEAQFNGLTIFVQLVGLLALGLVLGGIRQLTGSIIAPAFLHAASDIGHTLW
jgi:membrane protease YdiL (CAAX protease family)